MKVVVFSDAHGNKTIVERIMSFNPDADYVVSLGDSELPIDFLMDLDIIAIKGNYPRDGGFAFESILELEDKSFFTGVTPLKLNDNIEARNKVTVLGYPLGGNNISTTTGIVSRIEYRAIYGAGNTFWLSRLMLL